MMLKRGSQTRHKISETEYTLVDRQTGEVILFNKFSKKNELWVANNNFAGYVIVIGRWGYEFVCEK